MPMKQLISSIITTKDKIKSDPKLSIVYYMVIGVLALAISLFSASEKTNYIYNQF